MFPLNPFESMKKKFYLSILLIASAFLLISLLPAIFDLSGIKQTKQIQEPAHILTVSAEGKVRMVPDLAIIQAGVETIKPTASESQKENAQKMNAVINVIKNKGVEKEDIQTTNYNLQALYDWTEKGRVFKGYQTTQNVTVRIKELDKIGEILEAVNTAGANQIGGIQFTFDDPENFKKQASQQAITRAKERADVLAQSAGIKLGKLISLSEYSYEAIPSAYYALDKEGMGGGAETTPNIEAGESEITAQVTLIFEIK
ncbi:MAG: hypothetical protein Athens101410_505 [Parcubacteria group bacterium Athens1014_10]|nr:MAG: hypothetical protein Athens101410_505 [Parcubacteria group bacterium Athens1014_10]TSD05431.1 MAG: hypothetical protein Athens071412_340 [Parcubacteria group bacterium Athens0714_12]